MNTKRIPDTAAKDRIIAEICQHFNMSESELSLPGKGVYAYHMPRMLCMYLLHKKAKCTYKVAGQAINRTSITAFNACWKIEKKIRSEHSVVMAFLYKYGYRSQSLEVNKKIA